MKSSVQLCSKRLFIATLLNFFILLFIAFQYLDYTEQLVGWFSYFYIGTTLIAHFGLLVLLPYLLSLLILYATKNRNAASIAFIFFSIISFVFLLIDLTVYEQFRYHLSPVVFQLVFGKRATDIFQFSTINILISTAVLIGLILSQLLILFIAKKLSRKIKSTHPKKWSALLVFSLLITHLGFAWSDVNRYRPITQLKSVYPAFYPLTAKSLIHKLGLADEEIIKRNDLLTRQYASNLIQYPIHPIQSTETAQKNILIVVIDSWRDDQLTPEIMPNTFKFAQKSQVFENHKSGSNMTTGGIFSMFYGIPATYFDQFTELQIPPVLIQEIQRQNYQLSILSSSTLENPPFNKNAFSSVSNLRLESEGDSPANRDLDIFKQWNQFMDNRTDQRFFSFLFFDAAHGFDYPNDYPIVFQPCLKEVNYLALDENYDPIPLFNRYKNSLHFIDGLIGQLIQKLEEENLMDDTLVIITGDHGQEFNDNQKGYWQHGGNFSPYQIDTPFLVFDATKTPQKHQHLTLHYDLVPTLMQDVFHVQNPISDYCSGQNLYDNHERTWFICGYNQKYALIQKDKIIKIDTSGQYEATDHQLNHLNDSHIDFGLIEKALQENSRFYKK